MMLFPNISKIAIRLTLIVGLAIAAFFAGKLITRGEAERWQQNFTAERDSLIRIMRGDQQLYMAQTISMNRAEVKKYFETEWKQLTKDFGLKNPEQITNMQTVTTYKIETTLRDSLIRDTVPVKVMNYRNEYISIDATIEADTISLSYRHRLNLKVVLSKTPRSGFKDKILLRPLKRPVQVTAIPDDKNTEILKLETIIIK